jgi:hypothetical protein
MSKRLIFYVVSPNPDEPELKIEDSENIPTQFFATKCIKIIHKVLRFFRDYAGKKWPLRGSRGAEHLTANVTGFSTISLAWAYPCGSGFPAAIQNGFISTFFRGWKATPTSRWC